MVIMPDPIFKFLIYTDESIKTLLVPVKDIDIDSIKLRYKKVKGLVNQVNYLAIWLKESLLKIGH